MTTGITTTDVASLGVLGLAAAYRDGNITALAAVSWYLDRIARCDPALHAFVQVFAPTALENARAADARRADGRALSMLDGIPIALKDNIDLAGTTTANGVGALRQRIPSESAFVAARLQAMGCIVLGKLNMDEAALGATTNNPHFGRTDNPFMPGDTPGGSSGGSAAAVGAGLCAAALGTDTLGSVRLPAAYCGVVGFMGTRGMVSRAGVCALSHSLDQVGVLARRVDDAAALFAGLCGYDPQDDQSLAIADDFGKAIFPFYQTAEPAKYSLGFVDVAHACDGDNQAAVVQGIVRLAEKMRAAGHWVDDPAGPPVGYPGLRRAALLVIEAEGYHACADWLQRDGVSESLRRMLSYGAGQPASKIEAARAELRAARKAWQLVAKPYDFLLMPTAPQTSFIADGPVPVSQADFTSPASVAGLPAISLPAGRAPDGRALSVQIIGTAGADARLLHFAGHIEHEVNQ
ncbi:MAG: amidase [Burkholderiaceae bacterium]